MSKPAPGLDFGAQGRHTAQSRMVLTSKAKQKRGIEDTQSRGPDVQIRSSIQGLHVHFALYLSSCLASRPSGMVFRQNEWNLVLGFLQSSVVVPDLPKLPMRLQ